MHLRLSINLLAVALLAVVAFATAPQKQVMVTYPDDTPMSILDEAKDAITRAGGMITHEFHLIKGFAAEAPAKVLETMQAMDSHNVIIEEDKVVHANSRK